MTMTATAEDLRIEIEAAADRLLRAAVARLGDAYSARPRLRRKALAAIGQGIAFQAWPEMPWLVDVMLWQALTRLAGGR